MLVSQLLPRLLVASEHPLAVRVEDLLVGDELGVDGRINDLVALEGIGEGSGRKQNWSVLRRRREKWERAGEEEDTPLLDLVERSLS